MITLQGIVENIAYTYKQQFNETLKASIIDSVIEYRALLIRRDLERNALSFTHYLDKFCVEMETVNKSECPGLTSSRSVLRSKQEIPKPIRLKGMGRTDYRYIGSVDRIKPFAYATPDEIPFVSSLKYQTGIIYYGVLNRRLFLFNTLKPCKVLVEGIIEDPRDIQDCDNPGILSDEIPFACPADLVVGIKNAIKKEYFPQAIGDGNEVNIARDAGDQSS